MTFIYKFKKERVESGLYVSRPTIPVVLWGSKGSVTVSALIDSGSDVTVIPGYLAQAVGLDLGGKVEKLFGFYESHDAIESSAQISFLGRSRQRNVNLKIPVLITKDEESSMSEEEVILGVAGFFDKFDVSFKKSRNRIILKQAS